MSENENPPAEPDPATDPEVKEDEDAATQPKKEEKPLKSQLSGIALLLVVFGLLYLIVEFLPSFGDWLGGGLKKAIEGDKSEVVAGAEKAEVAIEATPRPKPPQITASPLASLDTSSQENPNAAGPKIQNQIIEALGGPDFCEVEYCAYSEDKTNLIAELIIKDATGAKKEIEVIFERDTFGRYLSVEDSPLQKQIKIRP